MNSPFPNAAVLARPDWPAGRFVFQGPGGSIMSDGPHRAVPPGDAATLESRLAHAFRGRGADTIVGGALPFLQGEDDCLWQADRTVRHPWAQPATHGSAAACAVVADPAPAVYGAAVRRALDRMRAEAEQPDGLRKVVLARTLNVQADRPIAPGQLLARLAQDDSVTAFCVALPARDATLVGATPELLLDKRGPVIRSHPLAGSARRSADPVADAAACAALAGSDKDRREHAMVVEYILDTLAPLCRDLACPEGTRLTCTRSMWHLGTRIEGRLRDDSLPVPVLAARLHPTPAVCGLPCGRAAEVIAQLEPVERAFYAGAVGWTDRRGDGAWYVAIRCAEICGRQARLFAGAGIVPGSSPRAETLETGSKFAAMLTALGLPADAALTD